MSLEDHEIPAGQRVGPAPGKDPGGHELDPADITTVNRPVYLLAIGGLLVALIVGIVGWLLLALNDKSMPEGLGVLLGSIGGALVGLLTSASKTK